MQVDLLRQLAGFYENELTNRILSFWLPRCRDPRYGGFFNCFDNRGERLISHDKYTWSQGRFTWLFAKLATTSCPIFTAAQRREFLDLARNGCEFLMRHSLIGADDWRCVFLMDETGAPKPVAGCDHLDMSIYADCFVVLGLARYASASGDAAVYRFSRQLYGSIRRRIDSGAFFTLPYPLSAAYRAHGIPMILSHVSQEMLKAAAIFDPADCPELRADLQKFAADTLTHFIDADHVLHEVIDAENNPCPGLLGQHVNPGHTVEDMWFLLDAADQLDKPEWLRQITAVTLKTLTIGWDESYGGLLHYCSPRGGEPAGETAGTETEPTVRQVRSGWDDKLWWVHSEALYTTLLCYSRTGNPVFLAWHDRIFEYTFRVFPNPDPEIREWIQIRRRDGTPQDKVVALPVKDPYHIARNLIMLLELLEQMQLKPLC